MLDVRFAGATENEAAAVHVRRDITLDSFAPAGQAATESTVVAEPCLARQGSVAIHGVVWE